MFENMPYTNYHDLNLDWIIKTVKEFQNEYTGISADAEYIKETAQHIEEMIEDIPAFIGKILIPDNYSGTDAQKLQACLDALETTGGVIVIDRTYNIGENLIVRQNTNDNHAIYILGLGKSNVINLGGYSFTGSVNDRTGGLWFSNVAFVGTGVAFDLSALIRLHFNNCYFSGFSNAFICGNIAGANQIAQSIYVTQCFFRNITTAVFNNLHNAVYDVHFDGCTVEWCGAFIQCAGEHYIALLSVSDCCIEGCEMVFKASPNQAVDQCVFERCYLELNDVYFDLSEMLFAANMTITDNFIAETQNRSLILLPSRVNPTNGYLTVERNTVADVTSPVSLFAPHTDAVAGGYKGIVYNENRFHDITPNNAQNALLPIRKTDEFAFTGANRQEFFANAMQYFLTNQIGNAGTYKITHTGQTTYMVSLCLIDTVSAYALAVRRNEVLRVYYTNGTVEVTKLQDAT